MLQSLRQNLTLLLLGLLPFHAFLATVGTNVIAGPMHAPLTVFALWKEAVLGVILIVAAIEIIQKRSMVNGQWSIDVIDWLILAMIAVSISLTAQTHADWRLYLIGFKYDFIPLVAFLILRRVSWSDQFLNQVLKVILIAAGIVAVYGIIGMYLSQQFFSWLGYSDLHSLYQPDAPLAAFQQIGGSGIRRIQSTMSGPNQLGLWLLIPLSIVLARKKVIGHWSLVIGVFVLFAMFLTLSRSALLAAAVIVAVVLWKQLPRKKFFQFVGVLFSLSFIFSIVAYQYSADVFVRAASTSDHISRPIEAIEMIKNNPLGFGLGTAGPASNRTSDTCVYLSEGDDPSWAQAHSNLCVFVGDVQVQPEDGACMCPVLPENWYLQIGVEMGVLGFVMFAMLTTVVLRRLWKSGNQEIRKSRFVFLIFLGISIAALFLHAWEDAAVAYTVWILVAVSLQKSHAR